uniref:Uncharacterized protein n=1 Tax=Schizaphis graminum TaxID=13262 RepID=A0A2S2NIQ8_SCHGA
MLRGTHCQKLHSNNNVKLLKNKRHWKINEFLNSPNLKNNMRTNRGVNTCVEPVCCHCYVRPQDINGVPFTFRDEEKELAKSQDILYIYNTIVLRIFIWFSICGNLYIRTFWLETFVHVGEAALKKNAGK